MAWFDKALKSVQDTAGKAAFEADKLVRANREASVLSEMQQKVQGKLVDLGEAALALHKAGALADPTVAALAAELAELQGQIELQKEKVEAIRSEQHQPEGHGVAAAKTPAQPASHVVPVGAAAPASVVEPAPAEPAEEEADGAVPALDAEPVATENPAAAQTAQAESAAAEPVGPALVECPQCHSRVKATAMFCPECGNRLK